MGSWDTIDIRCPRISRRLRFDFWRRSSPSKTMRPRLIVALGASKPIIALIKVDLPQPLSPTTPTIAPRGMLRLRFRNALSVPFGVENSTLRSSISRIFSKATQESLRNFGSNASRKLSPRKVNPRVVSTTGNPPAITGQGVL